MMRADATSALGENMARLRRHGLLVLGLLALLLPGYWHLATTVWSDDSQAHGAIVLLITIWLFWREQDRYIAVAAHCATVPALASALLGGLLFFVGRSQDIPLLEIPGQIALVLALILYYRGWAGARVYWFALLFWLVVIPLPAVVVDPLTRSLKQDVSILAEWLLYSANYPIARSGVILNIGPYQLLVADACSGLNSILALMAMGALYLYLAGHKGLKRNVPLLLAVVPIAVLANVVRVVTLILVTFYFGDAAGQGFVHEFAGLLLFSMAMVLFFLLDLLLGRIFERRQG
ncbi:exosortase B [Paludibacterium yongneupense]|uniref:exosortase B n=1 Tax=Paludibacterium yongneupense TaxID=400061 RepID=UPI000426F2E7|nr:exosortase B [Paludibacterium yongneupense]